MRSRLLTVMNENGYILGHRVTPDETFKNLHELLMEIWNRKGSSQPSCIYTDNTRKDTSSILKSFKQKFGADSSVHILQVLISSLTTRIFFMLLKEFDAQWTPGTLTTQKPTTH